MRKLLTILCLVAYSFFILGELNIAQAQSTADVIWQSEISEGLGSEVDVLRLRLEEEVTKIIDAGHLRPFRALYGEVTFRFYWYEPGDMILTLARAYPYLSTTLQGRVRTYVRQELAEYPVWGTRLLNNNGAKRQPDELTDNEWTSPPQNTSRPKLWGLYALWLYAYNSGDWQVVDNNWNSIVNFFNTYQAEPNDSFSGIAGAIGTARMARHRGDTGTENRAVQTASQGMQNAAASRGFLNFAQKAESVFKWGVNWDNWRKDNLYRGFVFLNMSPEVGRFINTRSTLKSLVLGENRTDESFVYSAAFGESYFPMWFMAQGPEWSRYFEEGAGTPPDTKGMLFPIHAWVGNEKRDTLKYYVDVPDALIGDCYYIQNLATAIGAYGTTCWEDLRTEVEECVGGIIPPTDECNYQTFPNKCRDSCWHLKNPGLTCEQTQSQGCDCGANNCWDGFKCNANDASLSYGIEELIELVKNWGTEGPVGDINSDSAVGIDDLIILVRFWGS